MRKLKECKNFAEIYQVIGDENFSDIAKLLMAIMIASPLFWGVINFGMLLDYENYNAYTYNDKCMSLMFALFSIITIWSILFYYGKCKAENLKLKDAVVTLKNNNSWLLIWFGLLIWTIIPIAFSANPIGAIVGSTFLSAGYVTHIFMFGILGCAALISETDRVDLIRSFLWISDVLAIILLAFEHNVPVISNFAAAGGISVYTNENHYGYYLAMACLVAMGLYLDNVSENGKMKSRIAYILSLALNTYTLMINDTLGAYLGVIFACIFMMILWKIKVDNLRWRILVPFIIIVFVTALSAAGLIPHSVDSVTGNTIGQSFVDMIKDIFKIKNKAADADNAGSLRWGIWKDTVEMILQRPIVGHGPDIMYNKARRWVVDTPHNEYLECAFYLGVPGLVIYVSGLITLLINKCRNLKDLSLTTMIAAGASIAYLISAFFGVRKFNDVCFFFMFMGLLVTKENLKKN